MASSIPPSTKGKEKAADQDAPMNEPDPPAPTAAGTSSSTEAPTKSPVCIICIGMAGSGKSTLTQRLTSYLHQIKKPPYILNLDPAVQRVPYPVNIDIRDTVDYKEVMKQ